MLKQDMQGCTACKIPCSDKFVFGPVEFHGGHDIVANLRCLWPHFVFIDVIRFRAVLFVALS